MIRILFLLFLCLLSGGCLKNQADFEKKILAYDPSFQQTIAKRNSLLEELNSQKVHFSRKKREIEQNINSLKESRIQISKEYATQTERIKRQIYPEKRRLEREFLDIKRQYKMKAAELRDIDRDINEIAALIKKKNTLSLTQEEIRTWTSRLSSLTQRKKKSVLEKDKLQTEIGIMKMKIKVLKL